MTRVFINFGIILVFVFSIVWVNFRFDQTKELNKKIQMLEGNIKTLTSAFIHYEKLKKIDVRLVNNFYSDANKLGKTVENAQNLALQTNEYDKIKKVYRLMRESVKIKEHDSAGKTSSVWFDFIDGTSQYLKWTFHKPYEIEYGNMNVLWTLNDQVGRLFAIVTAKFDGSFLNDTKLKITELGQMVQQSSDYDEPVEDDDELPTVDDFLKSMQDERKRRGISE